MLTVLYENFLGHLEIITLLANNCDYTKAKATSSFSAYSMRTNRKTNQHNSGGVI